MLSLSMHKTKLSLNMLILDPSYPDYRLLVLADLGTLPIWTKFDAWVQTSTLDAHDQLGWVKDRCAQHGPWTII